MALAAQEDDRWILTLAGYAGHHPPAGPDGFLAFAQRLAPAEVFAARRDQHPPVPGQSAPALRTAAQLPRRAAGGGGRSVQLQPDLRAVWDVQARVPGSPGRQDFPEPVVLGS